MTRVMLLLDAMVRRGRCSSLGSAPGADDGPDNDSDYLHVLGRWSDTDWLGALGLLLTG